MDDSDYIGRYAPEYRQQRRVERYSLPFMVGEVVFYRQELERMLRQRLVSEWAQEIVFGGDEQLLTVEFLAMELIEHDNRHYYWDGSSDDYATYYRRCIQDEQGKTDYWARDPQTGEPCAPLPHIPGYECYIDASGMWRVRHISA